MPSCRHVAFCASLLLGLSALAATPAAQSAPASAGGSRLAAMAEALFEKLPKDRIDRAAGFFAPVVKRYLPKLQAFQREYAESPSKMQVVAKYVPAAESMLTEAKAMKVPPRFEAEKADYLKTAEAFVSSLKMMVALYQMR